MAAAILTLALALNHQQLLFAVDILSESQFFLLSVLIIILLENARSKERLLLASALIGICMLSRSVGIAFLLPLLVQTIKLPTNGYRKSFILSLALLPVTGWKIIQGQFLEPLAPRSDYLAKFGASYADALVQTAYNTFPSNFSALIQSWSNYLSGVPANVHLVIATVLGFSVLIGWFIRLRRLDSLALYLVAYFGIVLIWPYPLEMGRFMMPVFPFLLAMLVLDVGAWLTEQKASARNLLLGILVITFMPTSIAISRRILTEPEEDFIKYRMTVEWLTIDSVELANKTLELIHLRAVAEQAISEYVGADDCVYALQPSSIIIATRKLSYPLLPNGLTAKEFNPADLVICDYVFMTGGNTAQFATGQLFPYQLMQQQMRPVFISEIQLDSRPFVVDILAKIIRDDT